MRLWIARLLIGIVLAWNAQAALAFIVSPASYVCAYELSGVPGEAAVRGFGVLFVMWNLPYLYAAVDPVRFRLGLIFALWMQFIGLLGESYIFFTLSADHTTLRASILRFILFDGAGLLLLSSAYLISRSAGKPKLSD